MKYKKGLMKLAEMGIVYGIDQKKENYICPFCKQSFPVSYTVTKTAGTDLKHTFYHNYTSIAAANFHKHMFACSKTES